MNDKLTAVDQRDAFAVLLLRVGLIWFLFLWAIHKILATGQYQNLARNFDKMEIDASTVQIIGAVQIAVLFLALIGIFRPFTYGAMAITHAFTIFRQWERYIDPFEINARGFPVNRNVSDSAAVMCAFIVLLLLIHRDHFSVGGWLKRNWEDKWWL
ncbi:MAG: hypothetical protein ABJN34_00080 [Litoreibacter sp.]|uniref:hypothetical protein n=1 Tax=Litoreibacter sp. TaxID=1969459 RepID=UPI00329A6E8D